MTRLSSLLSSLLHSNPTSRSVLPSPISCGHTDTLSMAAVEPSVSDFRRGTLQNGLWIKKTPSYYTPSQIIAWLSRVGFPRSYTESEISEGLFPASLENLHTLVRLQLLTFPFENTAMHYTASHSMDVTPEGAFRRLVEEHKGSYCFGLNGVLLGILQGLGYRAYGGAARVNIKFATSAAEPDYSPLTHVVIFVQPLENSNETYVVDVGFGSCSPSRPMLLSDREDNVVYGLAVPGKHRFTRGRHPSSSLECRQNPSSTQGPHTQWQLECWFESDDDNRGSGWRILFRFSEDEFFLPDRLSGSFAVSMIPDKRIIFWANVICVKHFLLTQEDVQAIKAEDSAESDSGERWKEGGEDTGTWMGKLVLFGDKVKRHVGNHTEIVTSFTSEVERIVALRDLFGIQVDDEDAVHIKGRDAAL